MDRAKNIVPQRLEDAVCAIGRAALAYAGNVSADDKDDGSPVTEIDRETEERLREVLAELYPGVGIVGEEFGGDPSGDYWIIDPIDGTRAFIRGHRTWSLLLALQRGGEIELGLAYLPASDQLFFGSRGQGAFVKEKGQTSQLRVSDRRSISECFFALGGLEQFRPYPELLRRAIHSPHSVRSPGDFVSHELVLRGIADVSIDPSIKPWDIAPMSLLVREAGGRYSDLQGKEDLDSPVFISSNGWVHDELLRELDGSL